MPPTTSAPDPALSFEELIDRLSRCPLVEGLLVMGSAGAGELHTASDYDLLVVLDDGVDAPLMVCTTVAGRLAEVYFAGSTAIKRVGDVEDVRPLVREPRFLGGTLVRWLAEGQIRYDRHGRLAAAQRRAARQDWREEPGAGAVYRAWFSINYNLRQSRRMLQGDDATYQIAVDLRMLYCVDEVWSGYFLVRGIVGLSEKEAIRHVAANDPAFLELFRRYFATTERGKRVDLYAEMARHALQPVGPLWDETTTAAQIWGEQPFDREQVEAFLVQWNAMVMGER